MAFNREDRYVGSTDIPLTDLGIDQAQRLATRLQAEPIAACYTSPLSRALCTAEVICASHGIQPETLPEAQEIGYGQWEGLTIPEMQAQNAALYTDWRQDPSAISPPGGETLASVGERTTRLLQQIRASHLPPGEGEAGTVLLVSHKTTIRLIICQVLGIGLNQYKQIGQSNAALNKLSHGVIGWRVDFVNDCSHLSDEKRFAIPSL